MTIKNSNLNLTAKLIEPNLNFVSDIKKKYQLKVTTSNLVNLLLIKGLLLNFVSASFLSEVSLPKKRKRFTLIRSPHVNKKSKEHFQILKHRRLFLVYFSQSDLQKFLIKIPHDIEVLVKQLS